jgi:hypothetical protein
MGTTMAHTKPAISDCWIFIADNNSKYWGRSEENMSLGYDIFRELSDGNPLWIAQAATLEEAQDKLETLARAVPAKYFIREASTAKIIARSHPNISEEIEP